MPMNFPDMQSLKDRATQRMFRQPNENETEQEYRAAFSEFMMSRDVVEACEIRNSTGWDTWSPMQCHDAVMFIERAAPHDNVYGN